MRANKGRILFLMVCGVVWTAELNAAQKDTEQVATGQSADSADVLVSHVSETEAFPGDELVLKGRGLDGKTVTFYVGKTSLKTVDASLDSARIRLPSKVKSGPLRIKAGKRKIETGYFIGVRAIPTIKKMPKFALKGGKMQVTGNGFGDVSSWWLGDSELAPDPASPATDSSITLLVPDDAPDEAPLAPRVHGRSFPATKTILFGVAPVISTVMTLPSGDEGYKVIGVMEGTDFTSDTTVQVGKKKADVRLSQRRDETIVVFRFKQKLPAKSFQVVAANGPFQSQPFEVDGRTHGFSVAEDELKDALFRKPPKLSTHQLESEVETIDARMEAGCNRLQRLNGKNAGTGELAAAIGECSDAMLNAMLWARYYQGALCQAMGKEATDAQKNAETGKMLETVSELMKAMPEMGLSKNWEAVTPQMLNGGALKKLRIGEAVVLMERIVESRHFAWNTCDGRVYGPDRKSARDVVYFDTEALFRKYFPLAFKSLRASVGDTAQFERQVEKALKPARREMADFWKNTIINYFKGADKAF